MTSYWPCPHPVLYTPSVLLHPVLYRKPEELKDLAPGTNPPFLLYNGTLKTDFIKIEEFLETTLAPPRYCACLLAHVMPYQTCCLHLDKTFHKHIILVLFCHKSNGCTYLSNVWCIDIAVINHPRQRLSTQCFRTALADFYIRRY